MLYRKLQKKKRERLTKRLARKGKNLVRAYYDGKGIRRVSATQIVHIA